MVDDDVLYMTSFCYISFKQVPDIHLALVRKHRATIPPQDILITHSPVHVFMGVHTLCKSREVRRSRLQDLSQDCHEVGSFIQSYPPFLTRTVIQGFEGVQGRSPAIPFPGD